MVEREVASLLLTGASGFLGRYLLETLERSHAVLAAHRGHKARESRATRPVQLDLLEPGWEAGIAALAPRVVVHAAAVSDPDESERDPERARALNFEATVRLARAVSGSCERFIYCSTDQVFDGKRSLYREVDFPAPISHYGRTKLLGEESVRVLGDRAVVARLSLLYGGIFPRPSFLEKMLAEVRASRPVKLFVDQFRTPLHVEDAAAGIALLLRLDHAPAVVHLGGPERLSRYDIGLMASRVFGFDAELLLPARVADAPPLAPRPTDVSLDISLARSLGFAPRTLEEALRSIRGRP